MAFKSSFIWLTQLLKKRLYGFLGWLSLALLITTFSACSQMSLVQMGSTQSAATLTQFRIGYLTIPNAELLVKNLKLAEERFPDIRIKWIPFKSGHAVNVAMLEGDIDVGLVGSVPTSTGIVQGLPYQVYFIHNLIGDNEALAVTQASKVKSVTDLVDKKIAVPFGSTTHFSLLSALEKARVDLDSVRILDMQPPEMLSAWNRGAVDGGFVWQPTLSTMLQADGSVLLTAKDLAREGSITADLGIVSTAFLQSYPDFLASYVSVLDEAVQRYRAAPTAAAEAIAPALGLSPEDTLAVMNELIWLDAEEQASAQYLGTPISPGELAQVLKQSADFMADQKAIPGVPDLETFQTAIWREAIATVATAQK